MYLLDKSKEIHNQPGPLSKQIEELIYNLSV